MKKIKMAINGFGRIGRHAFKAAWDKKNIEIVAVNNLSSDSHSLAHLLKYDTAYPNWPKEIGYDDDHLIVGRKKVKVYSEKDPINLPWKKLGIDIVLECTGVFRDAQGAGKHVQAGAKKVIISAPGKGEGIETYIRGVNCESYAEAKILDNASCTTNCTAPVMRVMADRFGVKKAMLTTIHSYTADQNLQDGSHKKDLRRARAAAQNIVPTTTGAATATTKAIESLVGKFDGISVRVPTITVSLVDFTLLLEKKVTVEEVNDAFVSASEGYMKGIMAVSDEPLVSSDYIGNPHSSTVDLGMTKVVDGDLVKILAWYDNEWGYANRLVEMAEISAKS